MEGDAAEFGAVVAFPKGVRQRRQRRPRCVRTGAGTDALLRRCQIALIGRRRQLRLACNFTTTMFPFRLF